MAGKSFTASIEQFSEKALRNMKVVAADAVQDVVEGIQEGRQLGKNRGGPAQEGHLPVDSADLFNSLKSGIGKATGAPSGYSYTAAIAQFAIGDRLEFEWTAAHALPQETGFTITKEDGTEINVPGYHYVGTMAARFSEFVEARAKEYR